MYRPVPATQPCTLSSTTGCRVYGPILATQPCTLASTTGFRVYQPVPAAQPCTLASTTGFRVYRPVPATQPCTLASTTGFRVYQQVPAIQPCTLALATGYMWLQRTGYKVYLLGTDYTALYTCFNNWFQSVPTGTSYTALYTCFSNWLHVALMYRLQSLPTGYWLHSPYCTVLHPNSFFAPNSLQRITVYSKLPVMDTWVPDSYQR